MSLKIEVAKTKSMAKKHGNARQKGVFAET